MRLLPGSSRRTAASFGVALSVPDVLHRRAVRTRGPFLTAMAVLFAVLAVSDLTKPLQHARDRRVLGMVVLGVRCESLASNLFFGLLLGAVLAAYAYGLWTMRRWVAPLSVVYAFWVPTNLVLFWYRQTDPNI